MKKLRELKCWLLIVSFASLINCKHMTPPPDVYVFEPLEQRITSDPKTGHTLLTPSPTCVKEIGEFECGHGVAIVSGKSIFVGDKEENYFEGKPWSMLRDESILVPAQESYAPLATYLINTCAKYKCSDEINRFKVKIDSFEGLSTDTVESLDFIAE